MKDTPILNNKNLEEIKAGKYKNQFLIYNRKSTDEPENQKNSLKYQKSENTRFAFREHLSIADVTLEEFCTNGIISEKHSAFKEDTDLIISENGIVQYKIDRPKFYQLIQFLNAGYFKGVIVLCWDRISRNKGDETIIRKLIKSGVEFRFVLATYDKTSAGALHMDIDGMFAEHHSRVTSEKVKINIRNHREKGICTYMAPVGYLNMGQMQEKPIDNVRAPMIKRFFELYATGEWTISSLTRFAKDHGFTMPARRKRRTARELLDIDESDDIEHTEKIQHLVTGSVMHKILTNPFYTGKIIGNNGILITSNSHKPLVSEELFRKVQQILLKKKVSIHYSRILEYPFRGMIRCECCQRIFTPYAKKEILYIGSRCKLDCKNNTRNHSAKSVSELIDKAIVKLQLSESELDELNTRANTDIAVLEIKRLNQIDTYERQKKTIREDLAFLRTNKLNLLKTGVYSPEAYIEEENRLNQDLLKLQEREQVSDLAMHETIKDVIKLSELVKDLCGYSLFSNNTEKERIYKTIFSELSLFENTLKFKCKNGFAFLQSRLIPMGFPRDWLSELPVYAHDIKQSIVSLQDLLKNQPSE